MAARELKIEIIRGLSEVIGSFVRKNYFREGRDPGFV